jgi:hypothetical protein
VIVTLPLVLVPSAAAVPRRYSLVRGRKTTVVSPAEGRWELLVQREATLVPLQLSPGAAPRRFANRREPAPEADLTR